MYHLFTIVAFLLSFNFLLLTTTFASEGIIQPQNPNDKPDLEQLCPEPQLQPEWEAHWVCEDKFCYLLLIDINNGKFYQLPIPDKVLNVIKEKPIGKYL